MPLFGQDTFKQAQETKGLDDPEYKKARETSLRLAGVEGIDKLLKDHKIVALVGPTMPAAWLIDSVHGDQISGGGAGGLAAVAGYPHLTVPMGEVKGLPVGLSFIGPKWADALILSLGYDYEQASNKRIEPKLLDRSRKRPQSSALHAGAGGTSHQVTRGTRAAQPRIKSGVRRSWSCVASSSRRP
jgi:amidase